MAHRIWTPMLGWLAAGVAAVGLAFVTPHERAVLGKVQPVQAKRLDQRQVALPQELPSGRTLAAGGFQRSQREEVQSWIDGLQLRREHGAIAWLKLPVLNDPGNENERRRIEGRLLERHVDEADRARLVPLFTDRQAFVKAAGLQGTDHASVLVLDRQGNVLARAEGPYDAGKAQALRETVLAQND